VIHSVRRSDQGSHHSFRPAPRNCWSAAVNSSAKSGLGFQTASKKVTDSFSRRHSTSFTSTVVREAAAFPIASLGRRQFAVINVGNRIRIAGDFESP